MQLRLENMKLQEELERLKLQSRVQQETAERETRRLHAELARYDYRVKRSEQELQMLKESRGKILRGLNTQTEVALVQLRRDFEHMRTQLLAKDEIIHVQEKRIASLQEANGTLRVGLQDLVALPKDQQSGSEGEGSEESEGGGGGGGIHGSRSGEGVPNGHQAHVVSPGAHTSPGAHSADLYRMITLLDSGKFDQS